MIAAGSYPGINRPEHGRATADILGKSVIAHHLRHSSRQVVVIEHVSGPASLNIGGKDLQSSLAHPEHHGKDVPKSAQIETSR